jgi:hypothetical protein
MHKKAFFGKSMVMSMAALVKVALSRERKAPLGQESLS